MEPTGALAQFLSDIMNDNESSIQYFKKIAASVPSKKATVDNHTLIYNYYMNLYGDLLDEYYSNSEKSKMIYNKVSME